MSVAGPEEVPEARQCEGPLWREAREYGIDMALLEQNLRLTPLERIRQHARARELALRLREAGRRARFRT